MNPYLEQRWTGVHTRLATYLADLLGHVLPAGLVAEPQERVYIEWVDEGARDRFSPDVHVYRSAAPRSPKSAAPARSVQSAAAVPIMIEVPRVVVREPFVEIIDARSGGRVVTVIEMVSPSNKASGPGRRQYLKKQRETRKSRANTVEIDLIRGGRPVTLAQPNVVPPEDQATYHVVVCRSAKRYLLEYYPCPLRQRLPVIKLPLRAEDKDVNLDLQKLVNDVYEQGMYVEKLDYSRPLVPPLSKEDAQWAKTLLRSSRLINGKQR